MAYGLDHAATDRRPAWDRRNADQLKTASERLAAAEEACRTEIRAALERLKVSAAAIADELPLGAPGFDNLAFGYVGDTIADATGSLSNHIDSLIAAGAQ